MIGAPWLHAGRHAGRGLFHALAELGSVRMSPPRDPRGAAHRLAGAMGALARAHDLAVSVRGEVPRGPALIVANHVSYLDPLALLPVCPAIPIARGDVARWPLLGPIGAALGVCFVTDDAAARVRVLRRVHDLLASGTPVLDFASLEVAPCPRGSFGIARRLGVPIVPVAIRYRDPAAAWTAGTALLPHYLRAVAQPRLDVTLSFGAPLFARHGEPAEVIAARTRGSVGHLLHRMRWIDDGLRATT